MDVSKIKPFIDATNEVFQTMFQCAPQWGKVRLPRYEDRGDDLTAVIGMSGTVRGTCSLAFPPMTSRAVARKMLQSEQTPPDPEIADALGELANMIAGCAKAKMENHQITISLPTVIHGENYWLEHPSDAITLVVPLECSLGCLRLNVTFSKAAAVAVPASTVATTGAEPAAVGS